MINFKQLNFNHFQNFICLKNRFIHETASYKDVVPQTFQDYYMMFHLQFAFVIIGNFMYFQSDYYLIDFLVCYVLNRFHNLKNYLYLMLVWFFVYECFN